MLVDAQIMLTRFSFVGAYLWSLSGNVFNWLGPFFLVASDWAKYQNLGDVCGKKAKGSHGGRPHLEGEMQLIMMTNDDDDGYSRSSLKDVFHFRTALFETFYGRTLLSSVRPVSDICQLHCNNAMQIAGKAFIIHLLHLLQSVSSLARVTSVKWANHE